MILNRTLSYLAALTIVAALCSCSKPSDSATRAPQQPVVYTTFYPTQYFAERIAGDLVDVVCPLPPDADPIFWKPDEAALSAFQDANLIILNGAGFERWVKTAALPDSKVVRSAKPLSDELISYESAITHSHGPTGDHSHEGVDGHTWVDPVNAIAQAGQIQQALQRLLPAFAQRLKTGYAGLENDLRGLDRRLNALSANGLPPMLASHPAYNYVVRRYNWNLKNLDLDPETMPSDEEFAAIKAILKDHPAPIILWESEPTPAIRKRFQEDLNLKSVLFSPVELLAPGASGSDYLSIMNANIGRLEQAVR